MPELPMDYLEWLDSVGGNVSAMCAFIRDIEADRG